MQALERELLPGELQERVRNGWWKQNNIRLFALAFKGGDKIVEIGSGLGICTQVLSRIVAPDGVVLGFEPYAPFHQIASNRCEDCRHTLILPVAVGVERGTCGFSGPADEPWRCVATDVERGRIPMHSLATDILGGTTKFTGLVLDAEGAEHDLLAVDVADLGIRNVVCEIHGTDSDVTELCDRMRGDGWKLGALTERDPWDNVCAWWKRPKKAK